MNKKPKFRSSVGPAIITVFLLYNSIAIAMFIWSYFLYNKNLTNGMGIFMLVIDAVFFLPLMLNTYYTLEENTLFIYQWPFLRKRIRYCDIFEINDKPGDDIKNMKNVALSKKTLVIGYYFYSEDKKTKEKTKKKKYIEISPRDMDLFLIKMGGKFKNARDLAAKLEEEHKQRNAEHYRKKAIADKRRQEEEEKKKPKDVVIKPKKKTERIKVKASEETEKTAEGEEQENND